MSAQNESEGIPFSLWTYKDLEAYYLQVFGMSRENFLFIKKETSSFTVRDRLSDKAQGLLPYPGDEASRRSLLEYSFRFYYHCKSGHILFHTW